MSYDIYFPIFKKSFFTHILLVSMQIPFLPAKQRCCTPVSRIGKASTIAGTGDVRSNVPRLAEAPGVPNLSDDDYLPTCCSYAHLPPSSHKKHTCFFLYNMPKNRPLFQLKKPFTLQPAAMYRTTHFIGFFRTIPAYKIGNFKGIKCQPSFS